MQAIERWSRWGRHAAALCLVVLAAAAQAADGANLAGIWKSMAPQASFVPEGGAIPFTAAGRKQYAENKRYRTRKQYDDYDYVTSRCSLPGMPRIMLTAERFEILQQPDLLLIAFEWNRARRFIALPQLAPQKALFDFGGSTEDLVGTMMGTSTGQWEGDTLVVTTGKFSDRTLVDELVPHGYGLKVTERLRLKDPDTLEDRMTIEDAEYFTRPWGAVLTYKRQPNAVIPEQVCLDSLQGSPPLPTR